MSDHTQPNEEFPPSVTPGVAWPGDERALDYPISSRHAELEACVAGTNRPVTWEGDGHGFPDSMVIEYAPATDKYDVGRVFIQVTDGAPWNLDELGFETDGTDMDPVGYSVCVVKVSYEDSLAMVFGPIGVASHDDYDSVAFAVLACHNFIINNNMHNG